MKTPTQAICWELWRTSRMSFAMSIGGMSGLAVAFQGLIAEANQDGSFDALRGVIIILILATSMFSMFWLRELSTEGHSFTFRLGFTRPVSTRLLVLLRLTWAVVGAMLCYGIPITVFGLICDKPMPLFGPMLIIGSAVTCFIAATWIPMTIVERSIGAGVVTLGFSFFLFEYHRHSGATDPYVLAIGEPGYFNLGWRSSLVLLCAMMGGAVLTVVGVDRQRHGSKATLIGVGRALAGMVTRTKATTEVAAFRSPTHAQLWFDFRRCAPRVLAVAAVGPLVIFALVKWALWMHTKQQSGFVSAWEGAPVAWGLGLLVCPFVYQPLGVDAVLGLRVRENVIRFSSFDATRCMSSQRLVILKMLVTGGCSLIGWLWMWLAAIIYAIFGEDGTVLPRIEKAAEQLGDVPGGWWFGAFVCLAMTFVGTTSMLMLLAMWLPMYPRRVIALFSFCYAHIGLVFLGKYMNWNLEPFWYGYGYVLAAVLIVLALYATANALRGGGISPSVFYMVLGLWFGFVTCNVLVASKMSIVDLVPRPVAALAIGAMFLPLMATVRAPMALNAWRHRA